MLPQAKKCHCPQNHRTDAPGSATYSMAGPRESPASSLEALEHMVVPCVVPRRVSGARLSTDRHNRQRALLPEGGQFPTMSAEEDRGRFPVLPGGEALDHEQASLLVPELVEERLAPEVAAEVQAHLSGCALAVTRFRRSQ